MVPELSDKSIKNKSTDSSEIYYIRFVELSEFGVELSTWSREFISSLKVVYRALLGDPEIGEL